MDPGVPVEDRLLTAALAAFGADEDRYWDLIFELASRSDEETFTSAERLTLSEDPRVRVVGLDVLGRLGAVVGYPWKDATIPIAVVAASDESTEVVVSAISALGHLGDERGLEAILQRVADPRVEVRRDVAWAITGPASDPPDPRAVDALIVLTHDEDDAVRDWATFVLGTQLAADGETVRQGLWERLDDGDDDVRDEALVGLARRHVPGAFDAVKRELKAGSCGRLIFESACHLADQRLSSLLEAWREELPEDQDVLKACAACDPVLQAERLAGHATLLGELERLASDLPDSPAVTMYCELLETEVLLRIGADDTGAWDVDRLLERAQHDPAEAAARALSDRTSDVD